MILSAIEERSTYNRFALTLWYVFFY